MPPHFFIASSLSLLEPSLGPGILAAARFPHAAKLVLGVASFRRPLTALQELLLWVGVENVSDERNKHDMKGSLFWDCLSVLTSQCRIFYAAAKDNFVVSTIKIMKYCQ